MLNHAPIGQWPNEFYVDNSTGDTCMLMYMGYVRKFTRNPILQKNAKMVKSEVFVVENLLEMCPTWKKNGKKE